MWTNLTQLSLSPANFVVRAVLVFLFVLLLLRISGKRQLGQMSATEFVAVLLISNAVQNSMNGGDNSLLGGFILAAALVFLSWAITFLTYRSPRWRAVFEGMPTVLIQHGKIRKRSLRKERITLGELRALLRRQGIHDLHDIYTAVLESDGSLSVTKESEVGQKVAFE